MFAHVIGYIGRISERDRDRIDAVSEQNDNDSDHYDPRLDANNYKGTDYIGKIGVEQSYETELHGLTGSEEVEVTAGGRPVRTMSRTQATPGNNLRLSLDVGLQETAERAFAGRKGALVAIDRRRAKCSPSSPRRASTRTSSSTASTSRPGTISTTRPTSRCSTGRCAAPIRPGRPTSRSWRSPR